MASVALLPQDGGTGLAVLALTGPAPVRNVLGPLPVGWHCHVPLRAPKHLCPLSATLGLRSSPEEPLPTCALAWEAVPVATAPAKPPQGCLAVAFPGETQGWEWVGSPHAAQREPLL